MIQLEEKKVIKDEAYYKKLSKRFFVFKKVEEQQVLELNDFSTFS